MDRDTLVHRFEIARASQAYILLRSIFASEEAFRILIPFAASYLCEAGFSSVAAKRRMRNALSHFKRNTAFYVTSKLMNRIKQQSLNSHLCSASFGFVARISASWVHANWEPLLQPVTWRWRRSALVRRRFCTERFGDRRPCRFAPLPVRKFGSFRGRARYKEKFVFPVVKPPPSTTPRSEDEAEAATTTPESKTKKKWRGIALFRLCCRLRFILGLRCDEFPFCHLSRIFILLSIMIFWLQSFLFLQRYRLVKFGDACYE